MKVHFSDIHEAGGSLEERSTPSRETSFSGESGEFTGGADVSAPSGSKEGLGNPEDRAPVRKPFRPTPGGGIGPGAKVDYKEKSFEVGGSGSGTGMGEFESGVVTPEGTGDSEDTRGIRSFQCPICGEDVRSESEEELSSTFSSHLLGSHRNEPFVNRLLTNTVSR